MPDPLIACLLIASDAALSDNQTGSVSESTKISRALDKIRRFVFDDLLNFLFF
jgi:hypothetical protein